MVAQVWTGEQCPHNKKLIGAEVLLGSSLLQQDEMCFGEPLNHSYVDPTSCHQHGRAVKKCNPWLIELCW